MRLNDYSTSRMNDKHSLPGSADRSNRLTSAASNERVFWLAYGGITFLALALRVASITLRPLHHDESVNYELAQTILEIGYYRYSPVNFHGPLFFYLMALAVKFLGDSELVLRLVSILCGVSFGLLPLLLRSTLGNIFVLLCAALFSLAPSMLFYSRFAIHEPLAAVLSLALMFCFFRWVVEGNALFLYLSAGLLGLLASTKETFVVAAATLTVAAFSIRGPEKLLVRLREAGLNILNSLSLLLFIIIFVYSGAFRWPSGLGEFLRGIPQWIGRSDAANELWARQPFYYYLKLALLTEPQIIVAPLLAAFVLWWRRKHSSSTENDFLVFALVWAAAVSVFYSAIGYKAPWLFLNISAAWHLLLAVSGTYIIISRQKVGVVLAAAIVSLQSMSSLRNVYQIPYGPSNPLSILHTTPEIFHLTEDLFSYLEQDPDAKILTLGRRFWPLPYYLRRVEQHVVFEPESNAPLAEDSFGIIIRDDRRTPTTGQWNHRRYQLSDSEAVDVFFRDLPGRVEIPSAAKGG